MFQVTISGNIVYESIILWINVISWFLKITKLFLGQHNSFPIVGTEKFGQPNIQIDDCSYSLRESYKTEILDDKVFIIV